MKLLWTIFFFFCQYTIFASPWVGGYINLSQKSSGANPVFEVNLYLFVDTYSVSALQVLSLKNDTQKLLIGRKRNNTVIASLDLKFQTVEEIPFSNPVCAQNRSLGISTYKFTVSTTLGRDTYSDDLGYYLAWERCCRNTLLSNIQSPGQVGLVLYSEFTPLTLNGSDINNSLPELSPIVADYFCRNVEKSFKLTFTDKDRDLLQYRLVKPLRGHNSPATFDNPTLPGPYDEITWAGSYTTNSPTPLPKPLSVSDNGIVTLNSNGNGLFTFTIEVEESRNGRKLGLVQITFQIAITNCNFPSAPVNSILFSDGTLTNKTSCGDELQINSSLLSGYNFQWRLNDVPLINENGASLKTKQGGKYNVAISDINNCTNESISNQVEIISFNDDNLIVVTDSVICQQSTIALSNQKMEEVTWYKNGVLLQNNIVLNITQPGDYSIKSKNSPCPNFLDTQKIESFEFGFNNYSTSSTVLNLCFVNSLDLSVPFNNLYQYTWLKNGINLTNINSNSITISENGNYQLKVKNKNNNCEITLSELKLLDSDDCFTSFLPNAFSPNNDNINDFLEFKSNSLPTETTASIYNRWGEVLYSNTLKNFKWDGKKNNIPQAAGEYLLKVETSSKNATYSITLLR